MEVSVGVEVDPIRYEMFVHRLHNVAEEGRIALQRVTASPIVVQGGECMSAFYDPEGTTILSASGHLRFSAGCADAVRTIVELFEEDPGIHDGDQFFLNDPYVCSTHVYDQMIVKPIFHRGRRLGWTGSMTHTADTGGLMRGASTEIFHEGIRFTGLKIVEKGKFRPDVFYNITQQCRDPHYVGLDLKSRIAANNVCGRGFLQLVERYGPEFVEGACRKLVRDSEKMARERLRSLPDGVWRSRVYGASNTRGKVYQICCRMTKEGDHVTFDFTGTSPQNEDSYNSTHVGSWGQLFVALTSQLFWNIPWNDGMSAPVKMIIPEGTMLNCRFPAACGWAPWVGGLMTAAASACIARMLYAGGCEEDVNASWYGWGGMGGPGHFYGGKNQHGIQVPQGLYDMHASGFGAAPYRDGVNTGGHMNNPTVGISDIENIEMNYPLVYLGRNHQRDSGGFGTYRGGMGMERFMMVYKSRDFTVDFKPYDGVPGGWGMFGGYPVGISPEGRILRSSGVLEKMREKRWYPTRLEELPPSWAEVFVPGAGEFARPRVAEFDLLMNSVPVGSGYGDPLDRDPELVLRDVTDGAVSPRVAAEMYGVVLRVADGGVDGAATEARRRSLRQARLRAAVSVGSAEDGEGLPPGLESSAGWRSRCRVHEYLEVAEKAGRCWTRCLKCGAVLGGAERNYKLAARRRDRSVQDLTGGALPSGDPHQAVYREYYCPGCGTLLDVEVFCPAVSPDEPLWDIQLKIE